MAKHVARLTLSRGADLEKEIAEARTWIPVWGHEGIRLAFAGDVDAVGSLITRCHDRQRAAVVLVLWKLKIAPPAFKIAIEAALTQTHAYHDVRATAGTRAEFIRWLRYANFELPPDLPEMVEIHRGVNVCDSRSMAMRGHARGLSWTLDFDVAAWFAMRFKPNDPRVLSAIVPRSDLVFYSYERKEAEVIPARVPANCAITRCSAQMAEAAARHRVRCNPKNL
jgi:hypothetical protein